MALARWPGVRSGAGGGGKETLGNHGGNGRGASRAGRVTASTDGTGEGRGADVSRAGRDGLGAVIDAKSGTSYKARDEDNLATSKHLEVKQAIERDVKATIVELLAPIPGVRVAIRAQIDAREVMQRKDNYQEPLVG